MAKWIAIARVPAEIKRVNAFQIYFDGINNEKIVLQCGDDGNWLYDAKINTFSKMIGYNKDVIIKDGKVIKLSDKHIQ